MIKWVKASFGDAVESIRDKFRRKKYSNAPKKGEGFEWISAEDDEENIDEPLPMFRVGDYLHIFEPHSGGLYYEDEAVGPSLYEVTGVQHDEEDEIFRYKLKDVNGWISEEWLSLPFYSKFEKDMKEAEVVKEPNVRDHEEFFRGLDEQAQRREIDRLLDAMNSGDEKEKEAAVERLKALKL